MALPDSVIEWWPFARLPFASFSCDLSYCEDRQRNGPIRSGLSGGRPGDRSELRWIAREATAIWATSHAMPHATGLPDWLRQFRTRINWFNQILAERYGFWSLPAKAKGPLTYLAVRRSWIAVLQL
jgi:hypothetical protein